MATTTFPNSAVTAQSQVVIAVPTLSSLGMVTDSASKFDRLLAHAFAADYNQSYVFAGSVTSIARILQQAGTDGKKLISGMQDALLSYFNKYYDSVTVQCKLADSSDVTSGEKVFEIVISVTEASVETQYGKLITTVNSKMTKIADLNNNGIWSY